MARSLGQTAYRALSSRGETPVYETSTARPEGELVWLHAAEPGSLIAVQDLGARLAANRPGLHILITLPGPDRALPEVPSLNGAGELLLSLLPEDHPGSVEIFLRHWRPDACVWTWGGLRPNLILSTADTNCPMFLIDADTGGFDGRRDRWLRDLTRDLLASFSVILTRSQAGQRRLVQLGLLAADIEITSPLLAGGQALSCADSDLADLSQALGGRPVWFANQVLPQELSTILSAHCRALKLSHRLLLILLPADPADCDAMASQAGDRDFRTLRWGDEYPDDFTQIVIADDPGDIGLFYRIAPVSFLGSSLLADRGGVDPFEAAALGSAILYGPKVRRFLPSYTRLAAAGAARIVNDADALGTAVSRLIAPDQAATMAHAGWDVISEGAALTDKVIDLVQDALDRRQGPGGGG
ncbi:3-deoxy-D-manno-octulosonic acid transferase [Sulfitobacter aestuarii]|uniref:3-deoxy-D-manno-octulosonic acid transferase n=1 Tax=Sulfitobacter aestuarii TaxID=2161676 RepID=A0ABW5U427_9RHOB